jgi:hypothetical protein
MAFCAGSVTMQVFAPLLPPGSVPPITSTGRYADVVRGRLRAIEEIMTKNRMLRGAVAVAVTIILFDAVPLRLAAQSSSSLASQMHLFSDYSKDFRAMGSSLSGEEWQEIDFLSDVATSAEERLYAVGAMLDMYASVSCPTDREKLKSHLKKQLAYYSWQMDNEADRTAGSLQFAKKPAVAQVGLKMKDDMRAAKRKLDATAASLE